MSIIRTHNGWVQLEPSVPCIKPVMHRSSAPEPYTGPLPISSDDYVQANMDYVNGRISWEEWKHGSSRGIDYKKHEMVYDVQPAGTTHPWETDYKPKVSTAWKQKVNGQWIDVGAIIYNRNKFGV